MGPANDSQSWKNEIGKIVRNAGTTHKLIIATQQMAQCPIPSCSPELTVVVQLAKSRAPLRAGGVGVDDAARFNGARTQAHSFAGVLLAKAPGREGFRMTNVNNMLIATLYYKSLDELNKNQLCLKAFY